MTKPIKQGEGKLVSIPLETVMRDFEKWAKGILKDFDSGEGFSLVNWLAEWIGEQ